MSRLVFGVRILVGERGGIDAHALQGPLELGAVHVQDARRGRDVADLLSEIRDLGARDQGLIAHRLAQGPLLHDEHLEKARETSQSVVARPVDRVAVK